MTKLVKNARRKNDYAVKYYKYDGSQIDNGFVISLLKQYGFDAEIGCKTSCDINKNEHIVTAFKDNEKVDIMAEDVIAMYYNVCSLSHDVICYTFDVMSERLFKEMYEDC